MGLSVRQTVNVPASDSLRCEIYSDVPFLLLGIWSRGEVHVGCTIAQENVRFTFGCELVKYV